MASDPSGPRVSVVIPTYNRASMLAEAMESVLCQTHADFELLVVDDGSTDRTPELVRERAASEPRLRYLPKPNGGTADARQHGLDHARGEYLALLDSDDLYLPRLLESQVGTLDGHPDADLSLCDARYDGPWNQEAQTIFSGTHWKTPDSIQNMTDNAWALPSAMLLRTETARVLGFRSRFRHAEDTDFMWRFVLANGTLVENPEVLTLYRRHDGESGEPQKIDDWKRFGDDHIRMFQAYYQAAGCPKAMRVRLNRLIAERFIDGGRWREARPYIWRWWLNRPDSTKALRALIKSLLSRR